MGNPAGMRMKLREKRYKKELLRLAAKAEKAAKPQEATAAKK